MASPIQVTYTPQATGDHVICYQQTAPVDDVGNFCCMLDSTVSTPGVPKIFTIPDVEVPSCDYSGTATAYGGGAPTTFNGYVYPLCDENLKTSWDAPVIFTP